MIEQSIGVESWQTKREQFGPAPSQPLSPCFVGPLAERFPLPHSTSDNEPRLVKPAEVERFWKILPPKIVSKLPRPIGIEVPVPVG